ncbi:hypothetical protein TWF569_011337 [Orbilia oligospora]|uniref:F-box domain-containing protein n=1 Tax=Orbilia oligospora TaxID=2813651 RepID=A0A7C8ND00_ORBOL|nr:hypothetical protein TWF706_002742 [Orbilia oligospora]KAF3097597.1 hypothetical protein TWF103_009528 [Orbilia oligospora]KAF3098132.1 hypothetical protein TWF102_006123 [Orbilia oligospora]KAF3151396.1 hypothetical protein TWF594_007044 [Orbilia oligospora]KAF3154682.1 hypothetical protein TWF569_011337 [Orbilia oligospora]
MSESLAPAYGHLTSTLPLELQFKILEDSEWFQHGLLSQVCKAWRNELSRPCHRRKLYQPIHKSRSTTISWDDKHRNPLIHKALVYQNTLLWDENLSRLTWAHLDIKHDEQPASVDTSSRIRKEFPQIKGLGNHPAFQCSESGTAIVISLFTSRYRGSNGTFFMPQRLVAGQKISVMKFLDMMREWRSGDREYRINYERQPTRWILCNYFIENCFKNTTGEISISVSVEMDQDQPEKLTIPLRLFAPRPNMDFDIGCVSSRVARNPVR